MIDSKTEDLINRDIDGALSAQEATRPFWGLFQFVYSQIYPCLLKFYRNLNVTIYGHELVQWLVQISCLPFEKKHSGFKTLVQEGSDRILGAHVLGPHAEEVINIFALAIRNGMPAGDVRRMIYAYPTSSSDISYMVWFWWS